MSKSVKQINLMANQHVPLISNILTVNRGLAYHVDPNLTGTYRNFVRIEAKARLLLPDQSYILDQGSSAGLASLIFKGASQPEIGETLAFKGDQYEISNIQQGIVYITPALRKDAPESSQFRSIAKQIESMVITGDRAMTITTTQQLFERDVIQLSNTATLTIASIISHEDDVYTVETVDSLDSLNFTQSQIGNLICAPQYVSDLIKVEVGCPYYLVFPFASYFQQEYEIFLKIENCDSKGKVLNSVVYDKVNPTNIRVPMFNSIIRASNLVMMRRIMGKLDYNKSALGFYSGSMVEWEEDFPETGTDFWIMSGLSETAGKLIVRYDPLGIVETVPIVRGRNNLKVRAFGALNGKCSKMSIGFISEEGSNAEDCFWLSEIIPNQVYTYFRYTLRIESETLFKREHLACYGPKVQPSLPSIDVCFGISRLDSGFLLP